jgi:predicted DCC family thiol-disulfide oxidoreductase YuxK
VSDLSQPKQLTVYFDGDCPICRFEIDHYKRCAGSENVDFIDVAAETLPDLGEGLERDKALARFHVRRADGSLVSGAEGFALVWQTLPSWRILGRMAKWPPLLALMEAGYRGILPIRARISAFLR